MAALAHLSHHDEDSDEVPPPPPPMPPLPHSMYFPTPSHTYGAVAIRQIPTLPHQPQTTAGLPVVSPHVHGVVGMGIGGAATAPELDGRRAMEMGGVAAEPIHRDDVYDKAVREAHMLFCEGILTQVWGGAHTTSASIHARACIHDCARGSHFI